MKVAVIGGPDMVTGFRLVGVSPAEVAADGDEAQAIFEEICRDPEVGVVICEDTLAPHVRASSRETRREVYPLIVAVPGSGGPAVSRDLVRERIRRAVGIDIGKSEEGGDAHGGG
ncbi:MAG: V-type ATP synthase subunit F [Methanomicrobiales archaeon]